MNKISALVEVLVLTRLPGLEHDTRQKAYSLATALASGMSSGDIEKAQELAGATVDVIRGWTEPRPVAADQAGGQE